MNKKKSFTLIELLVVIVIIGVLAGVIVVTVSNQIANAQDAKVKSTLLGLSKALKMNSLDSFPIEATACNLKTSCTTLKSQLNIPSTQDDIYYKTSASGNFFVIYTAKPSDNTLSFEINSNIEEVKEIPSFSNLVAYYPLSMGTSNGTTISDMSPNSNHGSNYGAAFAQGADGNGNTAMSFNGTNNYVTHANVSFNNLVEYSYAVWVRWGSSVPTSYVIPFGDNLQSDSSIYFTNGSSKVFLYRPDGTSGTTIVNSNTTILYDGSWHHVVWTINSSAGATFYIDGVQNGDTTTLPATTMIYRTIGDGYGNYRWNGLISNIRIYNKVLTINEIESLYNNKNA